MRRALWGVLLVALALRLWGLHYGLPSLCYFLDEQQVALRALRMGGTGDFNPHLFLWPASTLYYLAFLSYVAWFAVGRVAGWWSNAQAFATAYFRDPTPFYLLPRLHSVALGIWSVWLGNRLGAAAYSAPVGLAVALGLALNALCGHYAHLAQPVTAMNTFTLLGLVAAVRIATDGGRRDLVIGALALGLGAASQYHGGLLVVPLGVAVLLRMVREPQRRGWWLLRALLVWLGGLAVFLMVSPYAVLDFRTFYGDLAFQYSFITGASHAVSHSMVAGFQRFLYSYLVPALGWPLAVTAALGAGYALWRRTPADCVLLSFGAAYIALFSHAAVLADRYAMPLVAPAILLAARLVEVVVERLRARRVAAAETGRPGWVGWLVPAVVLLLGLPTAVDLVRVDYTMTQGDTRLEALRWFESHVPADSRVVLDMGKFLNDLTAPLRENRARIEERLVETAQDLYGKGHHAVFYTEYFRYQLEHPYAPAYYLCSTERGSKAKPLAEYRSEGFTWAMVNDEIARNELSKPAQSDGSGAGFYQALQRECVLAAEFRPEPWKRMGPVIRVYRIEPAPAPCPVDDDPPSGVEPLPGPQPLAQARHQL